MNEPIYNDPVVAEIHSIRQALLDKCGGKIEEYRRRTRNRQVASDHRIVTSPFKKRLEQSDAREDANVLQNG
jgi:hypothetical protein